MRVANRLVLMRTLMSSALILSAPLMADLNAQANGRVTLSLGASTALTTPGGSELESSATQSLSVTATLINCSHFPCTLYLKTNQPAVTFAGTGTPATALDYCLANCGVAGNWSAVPNTAGDGQLIATLNTNTSVVFQLRYRLGWSGSPFSPPGSYSLPIFVSLKN